MESLTSVHDVPVYPADVRHIVQDMSVLDKKLARELPRTTRGRVYMKASRLDAWPQTRNASVPLVMFLDKASSDEIKKLDDLTPRAFVSDARRVVLWWNVKPGYYEAVRAWRALVQGVREK